MANSIRRKVRIIRAGTTSKAGVDSAPAGVGQSDVGQLTDPTTQEKIMTMTMTKKEMSKAADMAAAKKHAIADAAADMTAAKKQAIADADAADKTKVERTAKHAAALEAKKTATPGTESTYFGSMTVLADRVKSGVYVKGLTGQLRSSDDLAVALDAVPPDNVIKLGLLALGLTTNPYAALNRGQQSMNLRNKMRGAIKAKDGAGLIREDGTVVTLAYIKDLCDAYGFATAEDAAAMRNEAKAAKATKATEAKAVKDAEKAAKAAAKKHGTPA